METLPEVRIPRLPNVPQTHQQLQLWWQIAVEQIETAINAQNLAIAQLIANEEAISVLQNSVSGVAEFARRAIRAAAAAQEAADQANLELTLSRIAIGSAHDEIKRLKGDRDNLLILIENITAANHGLLSEVRRLRHEQGNMELLWLH